MRAKQSWMRGLIAALTALFLLTPSLSANAVVTPLAKSIDVLAVDTTEAQFSVVANSEALTPMLSIQLATDYSFASPLVSQSVAWTQQLDDQDHEFVVSISGLNQDTLYFARAVLATSVGINYSEMLAFRTLPPVGIVINEGETHTNDTDVSVVANAPVGAIGVELSNSATFTASVQASFDEPLSWVIATTASGEAATVYARYVLAGSAKSATFTDDIAFDNVAPTLSGLLTERLGSTLVADQIGTDAHSGVIRLEYGYAAKTVSRPYSEELEFSLTALPEFNQSPAATKLSVRAIDRAGNVSRWYEASVRTYPTPVLAAASFSTKRHTITNGDWGTGATFGYQWLRDGKVIAGANSASYEHVSADLGKKLSVRVIGSKRGLALKTLTSNAITVLQAPAITKGATVSGKPKVGQTLTIAKVTAVGYPQPKLSYRWLRCTKATPATATLNLSTYGCKVISGATKSTYKLTSSDVSKYVVGNTVATGTSSAVARKFAKSTVKVVR
jgi:hypothetical protein